jgi:hypothetical protein
VTVEIAGAISIGRFAGANLPGLVLTVEIAGAISIGRFAGANLPGTVFVEAGR